MARKNRLSSSPGLGFVGGVGSFIRCDADDDSWFCKLTKFTSVITMIISLIMTAYLIYYVVNTFILKN